MSLLSLFCGSFIHVSVSRLKIQENIVLFILKTRSYLDNTFTFRGICIAFLVLIFIGTVVDELSNYIETNSNDHQPKPLEGERKETRYDKPVRKLYDL